MRSGSQTYSQTLKVFLNVWLRFRGLGVQLNLPPALTLDNFEPNQAILRKSGPTGYRLDVIVRSAPALFSLEEWVLKEWLKDLVSPTLDSSPLTRIAEGLGEKRPILVNRRDGILLISRSLGTQITAFILNEDTHQVFILKFRGENLDQGEALELSLNELMNIIKSFQAI